MYLYLYSMSISLSNVRCVAREARRHYDGRGRDIELQTESRR